MYCTICNPKAKLTFALSTWQGAINYSSCLISQNKNEHSGYEYYHVSVRFQSFVHQVLPAAVRSTRLDSESSHSQLVTPSLAPTNRINILNIACRAQTVSYAMPNTPLKYCFTICTTLFICRSVTTQEVSWLSQWLADPFTPEIKYELTLSRQRNRS